MQYIIQLLLPQLDLLIWHSSGVRCPPRRPGIPTQRRVTEQLTKHWAPFKVLRQRYAGTRFEEQCQLHLPQKHKATDTDSTLGMEMNGLEEQADYAKARELFWKPLSWLGTIRPTSANDAFDPTLWETFVSTTLGLEVPIRSILPRLHNSPLAKCGCKKFCMDFHGDHTSTCTGHSGATKAHNWMVSVLGPLFRKHTHTYTHAHTHTHTHTHTHAHTHTGVSEENRPSHLRSFSRPHCTLHARSRLHFPPLARPLERSVQSPWHGLSAFAPAPECIQDIMFIKNTDCLVESESAKASRG